MESEITFGGNKMTDIPRQWLKRRDTVKAFEMDALDRTASAFGLPVEKVVKKFAARPFGDLTDDWKAFVGRMKTADELWSFSSPAESLSQKCGCIGFAIVREGEIVDVLVTLRT